MEAADEELRWLTVVYMLLWKMGGRRAARLQKFKYLEDVKWLGRIGYRQGRAQA